MAPKRKAAPVEGRASKRVASGVSTPASLGSDDDDEYSDSDAYQSSERETVRKERKKEKEAVAAAPQYDRQWPIRRFLHRR